MIRIKMIRITKKQLRVGAELPIFINNIFEGTARLEELIENDTENTLFILNEEEYINKEGLKITRSYYYNYQKWKITFIENGHTTIRKIIFYVKTEYEENE